MAKCDQGYLCRVCGEEVESLPESELYLQFVVGWIDPEVLHTTPECHLRCNPMLAQFIDDDRFSPLVTVDGPFGLASLDPCFVAERKALLTRGYDRLWELFNDESPPPVTEYPLPEAQAKWRS